MPYMQNGDVKSFVKSKRGNELDVTIFPEVNNYIIAAYSAVAYILCLSTTHNKVICHVKYSTDHV